eukprot:803393-Prymnesium_polylepis.1
MRHTDSHHAQTQRRDADGTTRPLAHNTQVQVGSPHFWALDPGAAWWRQLGLAASSIRLYV